MNRRAWLKCAAAGACAALLKGARYASALPPDEGLIPVRIDESRLRGAIAPDFLGLGYEISSIAVPGLLSASNHVYAQMVRTLGAAGVIRIGGNTADYSSYSKKAKAVSSPKSTVVNRKSLEHLASFLHTTGWKLIWSLNLGEGSAGQAASEARMVSEAAQDRLLAFEIGNEPDLFAREGHRRSSYSFEDFLAEYRSYKTAVRKALPGAPFAGPDVAGRHDWVSQFAAAEASDLKVLTEHYYRAHQSAASSLEMLLNPDPRLFAMLTALQQVSGNSHLPYRISETNSFSGGGRRGISDSFGAALWVLDYLFTLASFGAAGVNLETGVNQLGFISSYSPIGDDEHGTYTALPGYYGMLAFSQAARGHRVDAEAKAGDLRFSAYAVVEDGRVVSTLINKDRVRSAPVEVRCNRPILRASALRLEAASLASTSGVTLGGATVTAEGLWKAMPPEELAVISGGARMVVPPGSAALLTLGL